MNKIIGQQSIKFEKKPYILASSSIVGKKEGEGPLATLFDEIIEDPLYGEKSWELAESKFIETAAKTVLEKASLKPDNIRYAFAGDLLGQLIGTTFGIKQLGIPLFGLYGACSTMGESLSLASMTIDGGYASNVLAITSSHFGSAEKQFRFPLEYGNQRPLCSTWTVTGSGALIVSSHKSDICVAGITTGKIMDYGIKDSMNMGAAMAPAASNVIYQNLKDFNIEPSHYDKIITGDLGKIGQEILIKLLNDNGYDISKNHMDCGIEIFNASNQDTHAGGSGCGCSAVVLSSLILPKLKSGEWRRVLFVPTGALLSTVSFNEGQTVPGIAHGIILETAGEK